MNYSDIRKVSVKKKGVSVQWTEGNAIYQMECAELPRVELDNALSKLVPIVCKALNLPEIYAQELIITGISMVETDVMQGVIITAKRSISLSRVFNLNTPILIVSSDDHPPDFNREEAALINEIQREAVEYIKGERAQLEMFEGAAHG